MDAWVETYTGKKFYLFSPKDDFDIRDIAHALANQCRFNGHTSVFYSVAQHCVLIGRYLDHVGYDARYVMAGLLHDAGEAYLGDIVTPLKRLLPKLELYDHNLMIRIMRWAGININRDIIDAVKEVDNLILYSEKTALLSDKVVWDLKNIGVPLCFRIEPWNAIMAEAQFLDHFRKYKIALNKYNKKEQACTAGTAVAVKTG